MRRRAALAAAGRFPVELQVYRPPDWEGGRAEFDLARIEWECAEFLRLHPDEPFRYEDL